MSTNLNTGWLDQYISDLFDEYGFETMTEEQRSEFVPQFSAQLQQRLGLATMKQLDQKAQIELEKIMEMDNLNQQMLDDFWKNNIPDHEKLVKKVLEDFAQEFKKIMAAA